MSKIEFDVRNGVGHVIIRNEDEMNALDLSMKSRATETLEQYRDDHRVDLVLVESEGDEAFCSGGDLQEIPENDFDLKRFFDSWEELFGIIRALEKPTIAKVDGWTLGGGFDLILHTDVVIASNDAMIGQPEIGVGVLNPFSAAILPELVGLRKSMELLLSGEPVSGSEAERIGLVTRSVPREDLDSEVRETIDTLRQYSPRVLELVKEAVYDSVRMSPDEAYYDLKRRSLKSARKDPDYMIGIQAKLEDREPEWPE